MRLIDLDPHWLTYKHARRVGFIFRSPTNPKWWQTCFVEKFYLFKGRDGSVGKDPGGEWLAFVPDSQSGIVKKCLPDALDWFQPCNPDHQWTVTGGIENATFETMSVTPSLDGSRGGLWHGHITDGQIVGGLPAA